MIENPGFFTTKGLMLRRLDDTRYVLHDVVGTYSLPFLAATESELKGALANDFNIRLLVNLENAGEFPSYREFNWHQLEYYYAANLGYALHSYLMKPQELEKFYVETLSLPVAYLEIGHGEGSKGMLETIDKVVREAVLSNKAPFSAATLERWLVISQFGRVTSEILSLLSRAITGFINLLKAQRSCIIEARPTISQLSTNEVIHHGTDSYAAATFASMAAISMCTSLDLLSKLMHYLDQIDPSNIKFKPAGGCHFSDLTKLKSSPSLGGIATDLMHERHANPDIAQLIQFRHDVVHSTSALELEKVYVGIATPEVNGAPLHYAFQGWRDCLPNGQPVRYLGKDFFVEQHEDIEYRIFTWLQKVIALHLRAAESMHRFLIEEKKT